MHHEEDTDEVNTNEDDTDEDDTSDCLVGDARATRISTTSQVTAESECVPTAPPPLPSSSSQPTRSATSLLSTLGIYSPRSALNRVHSLPNMRAMETAADITRDSTPGHCTF